MKSQLCVPPNSTSTTSSESRNCDNTVLAFKTADGEGVQFGLNQKLLHALCHMMITSSEKAEWDLRLQVGDPQVLVPEGSSDVVH